MEVQDQRNGAGCVLRVSDDGNFVRDASIYICSLRGRRFRRSEGSIVERSGIEGRSLLLRSISPILHGAGEFFFYSDKISGPK